MVNSISLILQYLEANNIKEMKKWSSRKNLNNKKKCAKKLISDIRLLLENISGNDLVEMIKSNVKL